MKQKIAITFIFLLSTLVMNGQNKLIYVGDPMCSWCYGFAPQLDLLVKKYEGTLELELVTGGLRPYNQTPISEMKDFLSGHWEQVHQATQQPFSYAILDRSDLVYDTEPACRAIVVVRRMQKEKEFAFFSLAQEAFYFQNKNLGHTASYFPILEKLGLDKKEFETRFNSEEYKQLVQADFKRAVSLGVRGFPSVLLEVDGKVTVLSRGYTSASEIEKLIASALK